MTWTGLKADGTLSFAYDGTSYEMELNSKNRTAFDKAIAPYIAAARSVRGSGAGSSTSGPGRAGLSRRGESISPSSAHGPRRTATTFE